MGEESRGKARKGQERTGKDKKGQERTGKYIFSSCPDWHKS